MSRRVQDPTAKRANPERVAFAEQSVELAAVALELRPLVEDLAERVLHHGNIGADADLAADPFLDIGRRRQVIGMDMGFKDPDRVQPLGADMVDDPVGRPRVGAPRRIVEIENGIDDRTGAAGGIADDHRHGVRRLVEEDRYIAGLVGGRWRVHVMLLLPRKDRKRRNIFQCADVSAGAETRGRAIPAPQPLAVSAAVRMAAMLAP